MVDGLNAYDLAHNYDLRSVRQTLVILSSCDIVVTSSTQFLGFLLILNARKKGTLCNIVTIRGGKSLAARQHAERKFSQV